MKTPPQPKAPRARVKAVEAYCDLAEVKAHSSTPLSAWKRYMRDEPVSVLPRSKEAQEALILEGAKALWVHMTDIAKSEMPWSKTSASSKAIFRNHARAVLASANLVEKE